MGTLNFREVLKE